MYLRERGKELRQGGSENGRRAYLLMELDRRGLATTHDKFLQRPA